MAIEKKLTENPLLQEHNAGDLPAVVTEYDDGTTEYDYGALDDDDETLLETQGVMNINKEHYSNLAEGMDEDMLRILGEEVIEQFEEDKQSCAEWMETARDGLNLLGTRLEENNDPFPGACGAHHPLILESAVKFQAKAMDAMYPSKGPVKVQILGDVTEEKQDQAKRVRNHMNYQITDQMEEYFDETERMLFYLPIIGSAIKKVYYNALLDRPAAEFIQVDSFIVNYHTTNLRSAYSMTHMINRWGNDIKKDIEAGLYMETDLTEMDSSATQGEITQEADDLMGYSPIKDDEMYTLLEHYCYLNLENYTVNSGGDYDDIALPYVVTVEYETGKVLAIRRNWAEWDDDTKQRICPFVHYKFVPGMGFYGLGYIHLLGNLQVTLTSAMRSLIDSAQFTNLQGGFIDKRLRIRGDDGPIKPGQFKEAESGGVPLKELIMPLQFKEPSQVLMAMYQFIEERAQKFADSTEQVVADSTNYGPVGTTMALLEASNKFFTGVHKRLHNSQKVEFKLLGALNYEYLGESERFDIVGESFDISKTDYDGTIDITPLSDPNASSKSQKMATAQAVYTAALQLPQNHDLYEVSRYYYTSMDIDETLVDKFLPPKEEPQQADPLTDIILAQQGKPIKAFPGQEHDAHVAIKSAFLQDPQTGGSIMMQNIVPIIQANIQEHLILKFQEQTAGTVASGGIDSQGATSEQQVVAMAAQKVAQMNQQMAELQAKGPDEARNKLADAELLRVLNESARSESETKLKQAGLTLDALRLELEKLKEDNKMLLAGVEAQNKQTQDAMNNIQELLQIALDEKQAATAQENIKIQEIDTEQT